MTESQTRSSTLPIVVLLVVVGAMLAFLLPRSTPQPQVFFLRPDNGEIVPTTFTVRMGAIGLKVEPAGEVHEGAGHMHILVDTEFIPAGQAIPRDEQHLHFGTGATEAQITLPPGEHILRLQFADGAHVALEGDQYRDEVRVVVTSDE